MSSPRLEAAAASTRTEDEARRELNRPSSLMSEILAGIARVHALTPVYPMYIAHRIRQALRGEDPERIIEGVAEIKTIGDCKYAIDVEDIHGQMYRVTVQVLPRPVDAGGMPDEGYTNCEKRD